jgi:GTPase SAR1 family protein
MAIQLPTQARPPVTQSPTVLLLYGPPKVGKSSCAVQLEGNLVFDLESGSKLLSGLIVDVPNIARQERLSPLNILRKYYGLLSQNTNGHYQFITFDTIDVLEDLLIEEVSKKHDVRHISDLAYGKGDAILRDEFFNLINAFRELGYKIILIGHRRRSIIGETGNEVLIRELDLRGKMRNMIMAYADAIGYVYSSNNSLLVSFKTAANEDVAAGSRCSYLANREIELARFNDQGQIIESYWDVIYPELSNGKSKQVEVVIHDNHSQRSKTRARVSPGRN